MVARYDSEDAIKMPKITLEIKNCKDCPYMKETNHYSTDGWDRMVDWVCLKADQKKIAGTVEWHEERKIKVPEWCPFLVPEDNT